MLEKLALLKMALWRAPVVRSASACRTSGEVGRLVRLVVSMLSLKTRDRDRARTPRPGFRAVLASRTKQYQAAWWYRARPVVTRDWEGRWAVKSKWSVPWVRGDCLDSGSREAPRTSII